MPDASRKLAVVISICFLALAFAGCDDSSSQPSQDAIDGDDLRGDTDLADSDDGMDCGTVATCEVGIFQCEDDVLSSCESATNGCPTLTVVEDCAGSGALCDSSAGQCVPASCTDAEQNGDETGVDCGGAGSCDCPEGYSGDACDSCEAGRAGAICEVCDAGTFCPGSHDAAAACGEGTWDDDSDPSTACVPHTECADGQNEQVAGTATSDTVCERIRYTQVSAGGHHMCALDDSGLVSCWGDNRDLQSSVPSDLGTVTQVSAGGYHTCVVQDDGVVRCWGDETL